MTVTRATIASPTVGSDRGRFASFASTTNLGTGLYRLDLPRSSFARVIFHADGKENGAAADSRRTSPRRAASRLSARIHRWRSCRVLTTHRGLDRRRHALQAVTNRAWLRHQASSSISVRPLRKTDAHAAKVPHQRRRVLSSMRACSTARDRFSRASRNQDAVRDDSGPDVSSLVHWVDDQRPSSGTRSACDAAPRALSPHAAQHTARCSRRDRERAARSLLHSAL